MHNTVILGDGLLGSELVTQTNWDMLSRKKDSIDYLSVHNWLHKLDKYNVIVNCIANTDTYSNNKKIHWNVNYKAVSELVDYCNVTDKKFVQISTDYVYSNSKPNCSEEDVPVHQETYYAYTKLLADGYIELKSNNYLIIRETHKPFPFPYENAWINQIGNFDYVNVVSKYIVKLIELNKTGIWNVGTEIKTMFDLAIKSNINVKASLTPNGTVPLNTTMDITKLNNFLNEI
jgi:nucleoside-diphosphate-sugar epimerase